MSKELLKQNIEKAQFEIDRKKDMIKSGKMRQHYHLMPQCGWMNDPNGLVFFKGEYHVFFQASPNHLTNHKICWGHCKSKDLLHWEYCPVALKPDQEYDKDGCFTGSAIVQGERLYLIYTGHKNMESLSKK